MLADKGFIVQVGAARVLSGKGEQGPFVWFASLTLNFQQKGCEPGFSVSRFGNQGFSLMVEEDRFLLLSLGNQARTPVYGLGHLGFHCSCWMNKKTVSRYKGQVCVLFQYRHSHAYLVSRKFWAIILMAF
jgi:hypothetical protein